MKQSRDSLEEEAEALASAGSGNELVVQEHPR